MAYDAKHGRLFVVETGNGSVAVVDINARRFERRIDGLDGPQGVAYLDGLDRLLVATHGDGSLRAFEAGSFKLVGTIRLGLHADNIRVDETSGRIYAGFGEGALAVVDALTFKWLAQIPLKEHPESFAISPADQRIYVNVPDAGEIAIVDSVEKRQIGAWPTGDLHANYPLTRDDEHGMILVAYRQPAKVARYSIATGRISSLVDTCKDADDLFLDSKRSRLYVVCGEGMIDIFHDETLQRLGRFTTAPGARTGLLAPGGELMFVAVRAEGARDAEIRVLKPTD
jgi:DNA-binding beta-propeller fold protein YncE